MVLSERENRILDFLVRDYVKTADPVSSSRVRAGLNLQESPATIRNIMAQLDEDGFLEQPHTSSGRIPTDAAYRYFVDNLRPDIVAQTHILSKIRQARLAQEGIGRSFSEVLNLLSFSSSDGKRFEGCGFSYLFSEPEFKEEKAILEATYFIDHIDEIADLYRENLCKDLEVFIGVENPAKHARELGVFYMEFEKSGHKQTTILVGPKRIDYERVLNCINYFFN